MEREDLRPAARLIQLLIDPRHSQGREERVDVRVHRAALLARQLIPPVVSLVLGDNTQLGIFAVPFGPPAEPAVELALAHLLR